MVSQEVLQKYIINREKPPLLYIAILANDLHGTSELLYGEQESWDIKDLLKTVDLVHRIVPSEARGSLFKIEQWIGKKI